MVHGREGKQRCEKRLKLTWFKREKENKEKQRMVHRREGKKEKRMRWVGFTGEKEKRKE